MNTWMKTIVQLKDPVSDAIAKIDAGSIQIALVVDEQGRLKGTVTDGDVRRGLLKGIPLNAPIEQIMRKDPITMKVSDDASLAMDLMRQRKVHQIPVLDDAGRVVDVRILDELLKKETMDHWVVLMAGGLGSRLRPLTDDCPKPMLSVGNKPILEIILQNFVEQGFKKFFISVGFRDDLVRRHFGDGNPWGVEVQYLHETERRGTAGALSLLPEEPSKPVIVMNGDLLTKVNFRQLLQFHTEHLSAATMCVREYDFQVPFGVVELDQHRIKSIDEKPTHKFFVNAGIYVFEPSIIRKIHPDKYLDMPALFQSLVHEKVLTAAFPIREYWMDIGHVEDLVRANSEFAEVFKPASTSADKPS